MAYWDMLLNHSHYPNAYYDPYISISNGELLFSLIALKDINKGDEITINYIRLFFMYIKSYIELLLS